MTLSPEELRLFTDFAQRLAAAARKETLPRFRSGVTIVNKAPADFDPVTDADREAERVIAAMIAEAFPDHGLIGEEFGERPAKSALRWVIDPVDGTRAFVCGAPTWTTLIALEKDGVPVLGVVDQPYTNECWIAASGETRFIRGETSIPAMTSGVKDLSAARVSTTDPRAEGYLSAEAFSAFSRLADATRLARFSFDAYAYGLLAIGELDIVAETSLQRHDYAALKPVVEGAGGVVSNWRGEPLGSDDRGEMLAAATPELHAAALEILSAGR